MSPPRQGLGFVGSLLLQGEGEWVRLECPDEQSPVRVTLSSPDALRRLSNPVLSPAAFLRGFASATPQSLEIVVGSRSVVQLQGVASWWGQRLLGAPVTFRVASWALAWRLWRAIR